MKTPRPPSEPMAAIDHAWLRMDEPSNLMTIVATLFLEGAADFPKLREVVARRLLRYDRFRQRVVESELPWERARWEMDPHFELDAHFHRVTLHASSDPVEALQSLAGELMSVPLDRTRPLWHVTIVDKVGPDRRDCALIIRLHHCIADGIALMKVLLSLTDHSSRVPDDFEEEAALVPPPPPAHLPHSAQEAKKIAKTQIGNPAAALAKLALLPSDPPTPFKGKLGVPKRATWTAPYPLDDLKRIAKASGGTINDLLLSAVSGALRRYLERHEALGPFELRAVAPVNLRSSKERELLGNRFGLAFVPLPIGLVEREERLVEMKRRMDAIKTTSTAVVVFALLRTLGMLARDMEKALVNLFGKKGSLVLTNVAGPTTERYLAGARLQNLVYWVPQSGRLGMGVSIFSYAGAVQIGIATDAGLVEDPSELARDLDAEIEGYLHPLEVEGTGPAPEQASRSPHARKKRGSS